MPIDRLDITIGVLSETLGDLQRRRADERRKLADIEEGIKAYEKHIGRTHTEALIPVAVGDTLREWLAVIHRDAVQ
jgi:hypothetical protein